MEALHSPEKDIVSDEFQVGSKGSDLMRHFHVGKMYSRAKLHGKPRFRSNATVTQKDMKLAASQVRAIAGTVIDPSSPLKHGNSFFRTLDDQRAITPVKEVVDEQGEMFLTSTISIQKKVRHTKP